MAVKARKKETKQTSAPKQRRIFFWTKGGFYHSLFEYSTNLFHCNQMWRQQFLSGKPGTDVFSIISRSALRNSMSCVHRRSIVTSKFPYGECGFRKIVTEGTFLIDKTSYIRTLEATGKYNKIWRPRRFGKTMVCDMLAEYYDAANSKKQVVYLPFNPQCFLFLKLLLFP
jgi:hypothetical protein